MFFDASTLKVATSGNNNQQNNVSSAASSAAAASHQQLLNQLQRQSMQQQQHRGGNLFAMPGTSTMNSTEELNQYNQALNALQSIESQFDLGVEEFLNDEDMDDQQSKADTQMYFDTASLYSNGSANPQQLFATNNNQFLHNAHNTVLQHNKLLQSYLTSMSQQQQQQQQPQQLVSTNRQPQQVPTNMNTSVQAAAQQPQNAYKQKQNSSNNNNMQMATTLPQQSKQQSSTAANSSSALSNFGAMISTMTGLPGSFNVTTAPTSNSTPISSSSSSNQLPSSTRDSNSRSSASPPTTQFFPTLDKGIHAVQQVIINGGITNVQVWSNCLMQLIPVLKIMDDTIPETVIGGKSVSNRKKTPLSVSIEVSLDRFRMLVSTIINMIRQRNSILEKEGDAFCQVSEKLNLTINLEDLKTKVQRNEIAFSDDLWRADVTLLMSSQEQDKGLTRDKPKKKKSENSREGFSVFSNPENPATTIIQYAPIKAGIVSNNKKNCQLRYKLCYDNWLTYYVDSTKLFAINCGKNTKSKRKSKGGEDIGKDEEDMDELSNNGDNSPPSSPVPNNTLSSSIVQQNQSTPKEKLTRSSSTASLGSSSSTEKPQTVAVASNGSFIVSPKSGSNTGGYLIFIQCNFDSRLITDLQEVKVFLGDTEVEIKQINQNAIFVMAPQTDFKGEVPIEIRTSNFSVSNPQDLKFEFLDDTSSNIMVGESKKRKYVDCCDGECGPVSLTPSNSSNSISSSFNPTAISLSKDNKKKKRKESSTPYRREWAIVIAIDKYHHNGLLHQSSASSVHDAMNISNILSKIYGFEVRLLLNEEATWSKVNQLFVSLAESDSLQNDDAILIFFTGVSLSKQYNNGYTENYLALYDTDPDNLVNTAISHQSFVNFHHRLAAKHTLFIFDTFYNGILMKVVNDNHPSKDMKYYSSNKAVQIICSSQKSYGMKPGVFSKELVNLLTTLKWGSSVKGHLTLTPFYTASDLGKQLQTRVHKETGGVQVPRFGEVELGGGNFLFIPKSYEKHSYNSELERIVSLLSLYEDYIQNMNLGDMHKHESLMALLKVKFFQISNYYLQTFEKLIKEEKIELRSDVYTNHKLNLTEIIKTVRHSYLALYRWTGEWILHNPYHLADANKKLLDNNPAAVVKRIFVVDIPNMTETEEKEYYKLMHYHHTCGIEVRVVHHKDLDDRKEIPHNFSILDSRLGHYLSFEDDYPKSVIIFNRKSVADLYYSKWVYVYNHSTPFEDYIKEKFPEGVDFGELSSTSRSTTTCSETKQCHPLCNTDHTVSDTVPPSTLYQDKNMSLTDPLLSFDIHENIETLQICLDPLLQGFKKKFLEMINTPKDKHARHCGKCLLLQKFHSISMHYENQITTFFSKGEMVVHANFYDSMRLRLHDIQEYVEKSHHMIIPIHSWTVANRVQSPYFTQESVLEVADMNKRVKERNPNVTLECIFVFHRGIFDQSQDNVTSQQIISGAWIEENNLSKNDIISGLKYYRDCGIRVMVTLLDSIDEVKQTVPGSYSIIDGKVCGSTILSIEPSKCSGTHAFYMNAIDGGESNVKQNKELFENLRQRSIPLDDFLVKHDAASSTMLSNEAARAMMEDSK